MAYYRFRPKNLPVITRALVDLFIGVSGRVRVSLDMGLSYTYVEVGGGDVRIGGCALGLDDLLALRDDYVYVIDDCRVVPLSFFRDGYFYKLYPVSAFDAPTLEISGIKMHRVVGITPWRDAELKVSALGRLRGMRVLDICTGLGYTAIHAYMRGGRVASIEVDRNVLDIASYNPWSKGLENIDVILGDAADVVGELDSNSFDVIIHDPPRFSLAGHLYSKNFYRELFRVLDRGGRLFHYTGKVGYLKRGIDITKGVAKRLSSIGFRVKIIRGLRGVLATKM